jgi:hypothetical protein
MQNYLENSISISKLIHEISQPLTKKNDTEKPELHIETRIDQNFINVLIKNSVRLTKTDLSCEVNYCRTFLNKETGDLAGVSCQTQFKGGINLTLLKLFKKEIYYVSIDICFFGINHYYHAHL